MPWHSHRTGQEPRHLDLMRSLNNAFEKSERFLRGIAYALLGHGIEHVNVGPDISDLSNLLNSHLNIVYMNT